MHSVLSSLLFLSLLLVADGARLNKRSLSLHRKQNDVATKDVKAISSWKVCLPFVEINGTKGCRLTPSFEVALCTDHFEASAGLADVRNGIDLKAGVNSKIEVCTTGSNLEELLRGIKCETLGGVDACEEAIGFVLSLLEGTGKGRKKHDEVMKGINGALKEAMGSKKSIDATEVILPGRGSTESMKLKFTYSQGVGVGAQLKLGWMDLDGSYMVGAGGSASTWIGMGFSTFAGWKVPQGRNPGAVRVIVKVGSFTFDMEFALGWGPKNLA